MVAGSILAAPTNISTALRPLVENPSVGVFLDECT
jgi:hypothetical protein